MRELQRILCVDDEPDIRRILSMSLRFKTKAEVIAVESGAEAFRYLDCNPLPDVILLDAMMPGMDGFSVCEKLRTDERYRSIPVIFLTAKVQKEDRERARAMGAAGFLAKPFNPMSLAQELAGLLGAGRAGPKAPSI